MNSIAEIAHDESMKVLVDGAQSFGATSRAPELGRWETLQPLVFSSKAIGLPMAMVGLFSEQ